jgi:hypothetical protein
VIAFGPKDYVIACLVIALSAATLTFKAALATQRLETQQVRADWAEQRVEQERVSRETTQENQRISNRWNTRAMEALRAQADERLRSERIAADLRGELDRVRGDIVTFAAGRGSPAADSIAACRADAATLGELLEGALRADAAHARAAEEHATDVRALLGAWPKGEAP